MSKEIFELIYNNAGVKPESHLAEFIKETLLDPKVLIKQYCYRHDKMCPTTKRLFRSNKFNIKITDDLLRFHAHDYMLLFLLRNGIDLIEKPTAVRQFDDTDYTMTNIKWLGEHKNDIDDSWYNSFKDIKDINDVADLLLRITSNELNNWGIDIMFKIMLSKKQLKPIITISNHSNATEKTKKIVPTIPEDMLSEINNVLIPLLLRGKLVDVTSIPIIFKYLYFCYQDKQKTLFSQNFLYNESINHYIEELIKDTTQVTYNNVHSEKKLTFKPPAKPPRPNPNMTILPLSGPGALINGDGIPPLKKTTHVGGGVKTRNVKKRKVSTKHSSRKSKRTKSKKSKKISKKSMKNKK